MIHIEENYGGRGETQVVVGDASENDSGEPEYNALVIHPWRREHSHGGVDDQVYLVAGYFKDPEARVVSSDTGDDWYGNIILESEDFIEAVLAAFPDRLQRKERNDE